MNIDDKYFKIMNKIVYNPELDKFGRTNKIDLNVHSFGSYTTYKVHYDEFDDEVPMLFDDFKTKVKFVVFTDVSKEDFKFLKEKTIKDLQAAFGDEFDEDMIMYASEKEKDELVGQNKKKARMSVKNSIVSLEEPAIDIFVEYFYCREMYKKYKRGDMSEKEMLYGIVNWLSAHCKKLSDSNFDYFKEYELDDLIASAGTECDL